MTLETTTFRQSFDGNAVANEFPCGYRIIEDADVVVFHFDTSDTVTLLVLGTDYSISGAGEQSGFSIKFPLNTSAFSTLGNGEKLKTYRARAVLQLIDLTTQGAYDPEAVEAALDSIVMQMQKYETAPREDELDATLVDVKSHRLANVEDPVDAKDGVNLQSMSAAIQQLVDGDVSAIVNKWRGTTNGTDAWVSVAGTNVSIENGYFVNLDGVQLEPGIGFTYNDTTKRITFTAGVPTIGKVWWVVTNGLMRTLTEYPVHDHDSRYNTKDEIDQVIGHYKEASYANTAGVKDTYTLSVLASRTSAASWKDGELVIWQPANANVEAAVDMVVGSKPTKALKTSAAANPGAGFIQVGKIHIAQYNQTADTLRLVFPAKLALIDIPDYLLTLAKMAVGTAGKILQFGADTKLAESANNQWIAMTQVSPSGSATAEFLNIPSSATAIKIVGRGISVAVANQVMRMRVGVGATPTYVNTAGKYIGAVWGSGLGVQAWSGDTFISLDSANLTATHFYSMTVELTKQDGNIWHVKATVTDETDGSIYFSEGYADAGAALTAVRFYWSAGNNFDGGVINGSYYGNPLI